MNLWPLLGVLIFTSIEKGSQSPVVCLLDFIHQRMVVALGTLNANSEERGRDGFGNDLMFVLAFE